MQSVNTIYFIQVLFSFLLLTSCQQQETSSIQQARDQQENRIEENTKKLLTTFLDDENMEALDGLLDESLKFHWPDKSVLNKKDLMNACRELTTKHDNQTEIIDIVVEDNTAFVLFVWSGIVQQDDNPKIIDKAFSIHDCYRLVWEEDKIVEWYTIWGSMDYLLQLGYTFTPPAIE